MTPLPSGGVASRHHEIGEPGEYRDERETVFARLPFVPVRTRRTGGYDVKPRNSQCDWGCGSMGN
ncbi:hypothetical protein, partial [Streptomyces nigrescens]|uniref:hypothetical protein n=1 Tax=Streptomyces nigrescens TaxID=1920 RepID=UPI0036B5DF95